MLSGTNGAAAGRRRLLFAAAAIAAGLTAGGCSMIESFYTPWSSQPAPQTSDHAKEKLLDLQKFIGQRPDDVAKKFGSPTSSQPMQETMGHLFIYAKPGQPHFVFETGSDGKIMSATATP